LGENNEISIYFFCYYVFWEILLSQSIYLNTLSWFWANQSLLFLLNTTCLVEKQQIPILKSLIWYDCSSISQSITLKAKILTITSPMWFTTVVILESFSTKQVVLRRKSKDWLAQNQDNVFKWGNISMHGLLFQ
jgi:hypothetical protein